MPERNVLGGPLEPCGTDPLTGFYRDGCCTTGPEDLGRHTIGNDPSTPVPEYRFPGLVPDDRWCQGAQRICRRCSPKCSCRYSFLSC
jgi:uncharacterized protein (DUF2237 family)